MKHKRNLADIFQDIVKTAKKAQSDAENNKGNKSLYYLGKIEDLVSEAVNFEYPEGQKG